MGSVVVNIMNKLRRYCAIQERCKQQIVIKLTHAEVEPELHLQILDKLESENFLNEERFARLYSRSKFNQKGWGNRKIAQKLKSLGISSSLIEKGLEEIDFDSYHSKLRDLSNRKFQSLGQRGTTEERRKKTLSFMLAKGYEMDAIYAIVKSMK